MNERTKGALHSFRQMLRVTLVLLLVCGFLFPVLLLGLSAVFFPYQAGGSLLKVGGKAVAAEQVGQQFLKDYYLWSRPSAYHYNVYVEDAAGGGSTGTVRSLRPRLGSHKLRPLQPALTHGWRMTSPPFFKGILRSNAKRSRPI
jgi:K+-transporting ATPase ATPase C chain